MSKFGMIFKAANQLAEDLQGSDIQKSITAFQADLNQQEEVRIFVDGTPQMGHQSCSVQILLRLIFHLGYAGIITVFYRNKRQTKDVDTESKLEVLLPGFRKPDPGELPDPIYVGQGESETANVYFQTYESRSEITELLKYGFAGGLDPEKKNAALPNLAEELKTEYFLCLQPYQYFSSNYVGYKGKSTYEKELLEYLYPQIKSFAYYHPPLPSEEVPWQWFENSGSAEKQKRVKVLHHLLKNLGDLEFSPTYSLDEHFRGEDLAPEELATTYIAGIDSSGCSTVVVNFGKISSKSIKTLNSLLQGNKTAAEKRSNKWFKKAEDKEIIAAANARKKIIREQKINFELLQIEQIKTEGSKAFKNLDKILNNLKNENHKTNILFLQLGAVPPVIFEHALASSTMPMLFEGANTAVVAMNTGLPYLQFPRLTDRLQDPSYPYYLADKASDQWQEPYFQTRYTVEAFVCGFKINTYQEPNGARRTDLFKEAVDEINNFIIDNESTPELSQYFKAIKEYYGDEKKDRFFHGLSYLQNNIIEQPRSTRRAPNTDPLGRLHECLSKHLHKGQIELIPKALPENRIKQVYRSLIESLQTSSKEPVDFIVTEAALETELDSEGSLIAVIVVGNTNAFGVATNVHLKFTQIGDRLLSKGSYRLKRPWSLEGVPWIQLHDASFNFEVHEGPMPLQGEISGTVKGPKEIQLSMRFPTIEGWKINADFEEDSMPAIQDIYALAGGINLSDSLPQAPDLIKHIGVKNIQLCYRPESKRVSDLQITLATPARASWEVMGIRINEISMVLEITNPGDRRKRQVRGNLGGRFLIGDVVIRINAYLPQGNITGYIDSGELPLSALFQKFAPGVALPCESSLSDFHFNLDLAQLSYSVNVDLNDAWKLEFDNVRGGVELKHLHFELDYGSGLSASLLGEFNIGNPEGNFASIEIGSLYNSESGWVLEGKQTQGQINLQELVELFLPKQLHLDSGATDNSLLDLSIENLAIRLETGQPAYRFSADVTWEPFAATGPIQASIEIENKPANNEGASNESQCRGSISAQAKLLGAKMKFVCDFGDANRIQVYLGDFSGELNGSKITFGFPELSFGKLLSQMSSWVTKNHRPVALPAPWNLLDSINLKQFELVFDTEKRLFEVSYPKTGSLGINLGFVCIDGITLYSQSDASGNAPGGLRLKLKTTGLINDPEWDATDPEAAPEVPGYGTSAFELRLLAMGQHVSIPNQKKLSSVEDAVDRLQSLKPPKDGDLPLSANGKGGYPKFDPDTNWLLAADFGLMKLPNAQRAVMLEQYGAKAPTHLIDGAFVFIDPDLYGIRLAIAKQAKLLAGLEFEILYKKIDEHLGVYQIELELPDNIRNLDFGTMSVTMPQISVDIYTNGDFLIDLGFPHDLNFARSFAFQTIVPPAVPMLGRGGFYFGALSGGSCDRLPKTSKGSFSPVTAFGIGFEVGFGKRVDKGCLKAGFSLTVLAVIEGVIARWNPSNGAYLEGPANSMDGESYYWLRGSFGLQGKLHGTVDFKLIKAKVNAEASAVISGEYESYRKTELALIAGVKVAAAIRINVGLFSINVRYSFTTRIEEHITLGEDQTAPWDDGDVIDLPVHPRRQQPTLSTGTDMQWTPVPLQEPVKLKLYFAPSLTITGEDASTLEEQEAAYVAMLFMDKRDPETAEAPDGSFELLCHELLRWLVASHHSSVGLNIERAGLDAEPVTIDQLDAIYSYLSDPQNPSPLPYEEILKFLKAHCRFELERLESHPNATVFPMLPSLGLEVRQSGEPVTSIEFETFNPIPENYLEKIQSLFEELEVSLEQELDPDGRRTSPARHDPNYPLPPSLATILTEDFFLMCARHIIQAGRDAMRNFQYRLDTGHSVKGILQWANETLGNRLNARSILEANANLKLTPGKTLLIENVSYQATQEDSLEKIARRYGGAVEVGLLAETNDNRQDLLTSGVSVLFNAERYIVSNVDTLETIAAHFKTDVATLARAESVARNTDLIVRRKLWKFPSIKCTIGTDTCSTLAEVSTYYGQPISALASSNENLEVTDLFLIDPDEPTELNLPKLEALDISTIINEMRSCHSLDHLAGLSSRYAMHGLRLPKVTEHSDPNAQSSIYSLTGQQITLPEDLSGVSIVLTKSADTNWLQFKSEDDENLVYDLGKDTVELARIQAVRNYARKFGVIPNIETLGAPKVYRDEIASFPLRDSSRWQSGSEINLPYQTKDAPENLNLRIWTLPQGLRSLTSKIQPPPRLKINIGIENEATGAFEETSSQAYGWCSLVEFEIQKFSAAPKGGSDAFSYELIGAGQEGINNLRAIIEALNSQPERIEGITLLYSADASDESGGMLSDGISDVAFFINRINLSTQSNPIASLTNEPLGSEACYNIPLDFIRRLWECSITRSGGYYLHYHVKNINQGLPDNIFDEHGKAKISLLVTYREEQKEERDLVGPYINTVITGDSIDTDRALVLARSIPKEILHFWQSGDTLAKIAERYQVPLGTIAEGNFVSSLNQGIPMRVDPFLYKVGLDAPGGSLEAIASYFYCDASSIKALNPQIKDFTDIPLYTLLRMPACSFTTGSESGFYSFDQIAVRYSVTYDAIAHANKDNLDIFQEKSGLTIKAGLIQRRPISPMGTVSFELKRQPTAEAPFDTQDKNYAKLYLQNLYQLLGYKIAENDAFTASPPGLPLGPTTPMEDAELTQKRQSLSLQASTDEWRYTNSISARNFLRSKNPERKPNTPNDDLNPYNGVGEAIQIDFAWQDAFGNRTITPFSDPKLKPQGQPLNLPALPISFTDKIIDPAAWPSVSSGYGITRSRNGPQISVTLRFDPSRYKQSKSLSASARILNTIPQWQENAQKDRLSMTQIYYQLTHRDSKGRYTHLASIDTTLRSSDYSEQQLNDKEMDALRLWIIKLYGYLDKRARGKAATLRTKDCQYIIIQKIPKEQIPDSALFAINAAWVMKRPLSLVHESFRDINEFSNSRLTLQPSSHSKHSDTKSIADFANAFEDAFASSDGDVVKLATAARSKESDNTLWAVRFNSNHSNGIQITPQKDPVFLAPRPLSTELITETAVPIYAYTKDKGIDWKNESETINISKVDLDDWARDFLATLDNLLAPVISTPAFIVDHMRQTDNLERLLRAKAKLAGVIAKQIAPVLIEQELDDEALQAVHESVRQQCLIRLGTAYDLDAAVNYKLKVESPFEDSPERPAPRLRMSPEPANPELHDSSQFSLNVSPLSLAQSDDEKPSNLVLLVRTQCDSPASSIDIQLDLLGTHLENEIKEIEALGDFESSSWLSFIVPPKANKTSPLRISLGDPVQTPIPLRAFPTPPSMRQQDFKGLSTKSSEIEGSIKWEYKFEYAVKHAPQDNYDVRVHFNVNDEAGNYSNDSITLPHALAQFRHTIGAIRKDLIAATKEVSCNGNSEQPYFKETSTCLQSIAEMTERITSAWERWIQHDDSRKQNGAVRAQEIIDFSILESPDLENERALIVSVKNWDAGKDLPRIEIPGYQIEPDSKQTGVYRYRSEESPKQYLSYDQALDIELRSVVLTNLNILQRQNAWSSVRVVRNRHLIENRPSNDDFVYTTPPVFFSNPLTPALRYDSPYNIALLRGENTGRRLLSEHLCTFFETLMSYSQGARLSLQIEFKCSLELSSTTPAVEVPVMLLPRYELSHESSREDQLYSGDAKTLSKKLAHTLNTWRLYNFAPEEVARFNLNLSILSKTASAPLPILNLSQLYLQFIDIELGEESIGGMAELHKPR